MGFTIFVLEQARIAQKINEGLKERKWQSWGREGRRGEQEEVGHRESYLGQRAAGSRSKWRRWDD